MGNFNVVITIHIIDIDDRKNQILIFVDEDGEIPNIIADCGISIEKQIYDKLCKYFHDESVESMILGKRISEIKIDDDSLHVSYNIFNASKEKCGRFIPFNKKSMELYRFINHNKTHE